MCKIMCYCRHTQGDTFTQWRESIETQLKHKYAKQTQFEQKDLGKQSMQRKIETSTYVIKTETRLVIREFDGATSIKMYLSEQRTIRPQAFIGRNHQTATISSYFATINSRLVLVVWSSKKKRR